MKLNVVHLKPLRLECWVISSLNIEVVFCVRLFQVVLLAQLLREFQYIQVSLENSQEEYQNQYLTSSTLIDELILDLHCEKKNFTVVQIYKSIYSIQLVPR